MLNKEDLKALGLTDEQVEKVQQGYSDAIPRTHLNELNGDDYLTVVIEDLVAKNKRG